MARFESDRIRRERTLDIEALYLSGYTQQECADTYGLTKSAVSSMLRKRGVAIRPIGNTVEATPARLAAAERDYLSRRQSYDEVAKRHRLQRRVLRDHLAAGGSLRERRDPTPRVELAKRANELYKQGMSAKQVGRIMGRSDSYVLILLREFGYKRRPAGFQPGHKGFPRRAS